MAQVTFRFLEPISFFGDLITWRLRERFSHVAIVIGDYAYSSTFPLVAMVPLSHHTVSSDTRNCQDITLDVTDEQLVGIQTWCETQLCKPYDFISIAGWLFGIHSWKSINATYCFEFCRRPLTFLGLLPSNDDHRLITGHQLYRELAALAGITPETGFETTKPSRKKQDAIDHVEEIEFWSLVATGAYEIEQQYHADPEAGQKEPQASESPAL